MRSVPRPRHLAAARFGTRGGSYKCCGAEGRSRDATVGSPRGGGAGSREKAAARAVRLWCGARPARGHVQIVRGRRPDSTATVLFAKTAGAYLRGFKYNLISCRNLHVWLRSP